MDFQSDLDSYVMKTLNTFKNVAYVNDIELYDFCIGVKLDHIFYKKYNLNDSIQITIEPEKSSNTLRVRYWYKKKLIETSKLINIVSILDILLMCIWQDSATPTNPDLINCSLIEKTIGAYTPQHPDVKHPDDEYIFVRDEHKFDRFDSSETHDTLDEKC